MAKGKKPTNIITVYNIDVEFISVKKDTYNNIVYYFNVSGEVNTLTSMLQSGKDTGYVMPMWMTDKNEIILNIKNKYIKMYFVFEKGDIIY